MIGILWIAVSRVPHRFEKILTSNGIGFQCQKTEQLGAFSWAFYAVKFRPKYFETLSASKIMLSIGSQIRFLPSVSVQIEGLGLSQTPIKNDGNTQATWLDKMAALALSQLSWNIGITETDFIAGKLKGVSAQFGISLFQIDYHLMGFHTEFGAFKFYGKAQFSKDNLKIKEGSLESGILARYGIPEAKTTGEYAFSAHQWKGSLTDPKTNSKISASGAGIAKPSDIKYELRDIDLQKVMSDSSHFPIKGNLAGEFLQHGETIEGTAKIKDFVLKSVSIAEMFKKELQKTVPFITISSSDLIKTEKWDELSSRITIAKGVGLLSSFVAKRKALEIRSEKILFGVDGSLNGTLSCITELSFFPSPLDQILMGVLGERILIPVTLRGTVRTPNLVADPQAIHELGQKLKVGLVNKFLKK